MYRKFKPPFLARDVARNRESCQFALSLMKIPLLLQLARAAERSEVLDWLAAVVFA